MSLYSTTKGKTMDDIVFSIADQIKHGIDNLEDGNRELRLDIAKLNELAGTKAATCSDHVTSRSYLTFALSLLPTDHWKSHYDISLRFSLRLAKSCYSCGDLEKAQCILAETLGQCHSLEDKLPGNALLARSESHHACLDFCESHLPCCILLTIFFATVLFDRKSFIDAYTLCHEVLSQLGEEIPESLQGNQMSEMAESTSKLLRSISDSDLLEMKEMDDRLSITMNFYSIISQVACFRKPEMVPFFVCRRVQLTMEKGLCKYSIVGFVSYAWALCDDKIAKKDIENASRIGKAAMSCWMKRYHTTELLPNLYLSYYGFVAFHTEPLQVCANMLRQGFDVGMSLGETGIAFFNLSRYIEIALMAGDKLPTLLEKVDYYLKLANTYQNETAKLFLSLHRERISILMDKEGTAIDVPDTASENVLSSVYFNRAIQAYWQGHSERCQHYIKKSSYTTNSDACQLLLITFIDGMNSFQLLKRTSNGKLRSIPRNAIIVLKNVASLSSWNFLNKVRYDQTPLDAIVFMKSLISLLYLLRYSSQVHLLEAEQFSLQNLNSEAQASYAAAISSARSSGFIHEQGLACELAGHHYKKVFDLRSAWSFFDQAKRCYTEWGSQMKVDSVTQQLDSLSDYAPVGPSSSSSS
jgi:predicted ATPase